MARVVVGMSGGVDSSLAAALVRDQGHEAIGITMKLWPCAEADGGFSRADACCSPRETIDARAVAQGLGISHYVLDLETEFQRAVVDAFVAAYAQGRTPIPCVTCNERIKFGELWDHARALGAERVATGHYARVGTAFADRWALRCAVDRDKDQTYFLFSLTQEQLSRSEFPVGAMTKAEVRAAAAVRGLATAAKADSQDLCFVSGDGVGAFLRRAIPAAFVPGPIRLEDGTEVGRHQGLPGHTIGQRKGLGVAWREPLHVLALDVAANTVVVGPRERLLSEAIDIDACTWHLGPLPRAGLACRVRVRHRGAAAEALILPDPEDPRRAHVRLRQPQQRVSPGQACVAYDHTDEWCLGGGWIAGDATERQAAPASLAAAPA